MAKHHGLRYTRLHSIWNSMKTRCYNPSAINYRWYGAKGIKVCSEWQSFLPFYEWAMSNGYADHLTLDRIDSELDYFPENCRWVSISDQQRNRSNNVLITMKNETKCLSEWARVTGVYWATARKRHGRGMTWEEAFEMK